MDDPILSNQGSKDSLFKELFSPAKRPHQAIDDPNQVTKHLFPEANESPHAFPNSVFLKDIIIVLRKCTGQIINVIMVHTDANIIEAMQNAKPRFPCIVIFPIRPIQFMNVIKVEK